MAGTCRAGLWPILGRWGEPELRIKTLQDLESFLVMLSFPLKEDGLLSFFGVAFFQKPPNSTFGRLVEAHGDGQGGHTRPVWLRSSGCQRGKRFCFF